MENEKKQKDKKDKLRFIDYLVIILCLLGAAYSVNLFRLSLFQTLGGQNKTFIGNVIVKKNTIQRRMSDRQLWDRVAKESPVYSGDIIRVADSSEADLHVGSNKLSLDENTLVRLHYDEDDGEYQINLNSGNIGLVTSADGGKVSLNIMGKKVEVQPGTSLNAAMGVNGMSLQVSEGAAVIDGLEQLSSGDMIAMDGEGAVSLEPMIMVTQPRPNAVYRKSASPLNVDFLWNKINIKDDEALRLEISEDKNFNRPIVLNGLNSSAQTALEAGTWNWRIKYGESALAFGSFVITEVFGMELLSPARNQQFYFESEPPKVHFQWSQAEDVLHYNFEVDVTPEFRNPIIKKQTEITSFTDSNLGEGVWYWRVTPVFSESGGSNAAAGSNSLAQTSIFRVVKDKEPPTPQFLTLEEPLAPEPAIAAITAPDPASNSRLPAPLNRQPANNYRVGIEEAKRGNVTFRWSAVPGANAYLFAIYQETGTARRQVTQVGPVNRTTMTMTIKTLGRGNFVWRVEAVRVGQDNIIEQRGIPGENRFVVDIPRAGQVQIPGVHQ